MDFDPRDITDGTYRGLIGPLLNLPQRHRGTFGRLVFVNADSENDGVSPEIRTIRAYEARRTPTPVQTAVDALTGAVVAVATAVAKVTKIDAAKAWLISRLVDGPVDAVTIEEEGKLAGHSLKNLKTAKKRIKAGSLRRGHSWRWVLPVAGKSPGVE